MGFTEGQVVHLRIAGHARRVVVAVASALLTAALLLIADGIWANEARANHCPEQVTDPFSPLCKKPNILFIVTDDQRIRTVEDLEPTVDGPDADSDPANEYWMPSVRNYFRNNLQNGMPQGTVFNFAFSTTPECCPSRASILTGRYAHNHGVQSIRNNPGGNGADRLAQDTTLAQYLANSGYTNAIFGKYLNGWDIRNQPPYFQTWGTFGGGYLPPPAGSCQISTGVGCVNENGQLHELPEYSTNWVEGNALEFLDTRETVENLFHVDTPWFMYVAPYAPHPEVVIGDEFSPRPVPEPGVYDSLSVPTYQPDANYFEVDKNDKPPYVRADGKRAGTPPNDYPAGVCCKRPPDHPKEPHSKEDVVADRENHLRALKSVDDMVGTIFQKLQATGEDNDTLAIYISDNGYLWGEHGLEAKATPYSNSIRVPMFMRWPGHAGIDPPSGGSQPPGTLPTADSRMVANIDLTPTALAAARVPVGPPNSSCAMGNMPACNVIDGKSLFDLTAPPRNRLLFEYWNECPDPNAADCVHSLHPVPTWASTRSPQGPGSYQYTEYYTDTYLPDGNDNGFKEYYSLTGAGATQLTNILADGNNGNDPALGPLASQLTDDKNCAGTGPVPLVSGHRPCP